MILLSSYLLADEEIAVVMRNEEQVSVSALDGFRIDLLNHTYRLLENHISKISTLLSQSQQVVAENLNQLAQTSRNMEEMLILIEQDQNREELMETLRRIESAANRSAEAAMARAEERGAITPANESTPAKIAIEAFPMAEPLVADQEDVDQSTAFWGKSKKEIPQTPVIEQPVTPSPALADLPIFTWRPKMETHDFYLGGEYLYWRAYEQATDFVVQEALVQAQLPAPVPFTAQWGKVIEAKFNTASGFRVAMGYICGSDYWDLGLEYTYIAPRRSFTVTPKPSNSYLYSTYTNFTWDGMTNANSKMGMDYNVADLFLAKRFLLSKKIILRWVMAGTGAWISQNWNVVNTGLFGTPAAPGYAVSQNHWNFQGGGFKTGFESDWNFGSSGVSLLGKFKFGLLFGTYYNTRLRAGGYLPEHTTGTVDSNAKLRDHRFIPTLQFSMGPSWGERWDSWAINLFAGYELNIWGNLHEVLYSDAINDPWNARPSRYAQGIFGFQGLTARMQLNF